MGAAAVGDNVTLPWQIRKAALEFFEGDGECAWNVPRAVFLRGRHVQHSDRPLAELVE